MRGWDKIAAAAVIAVMCSGANKPVAKPTSRAAASKTPVKKRAPLSPAAVLASAILQNSANPDDKNLYSSCLNADFKRLALALDGAKFIQAEKSEFETEAEFADRASRVQTALTGSGKSLIVCKSLQRGPHAEFTYNADTQAFSGSFDTTLRGDLDYKDLPSYVGKTRMGVSFRISRSVEIDYMADFQSIASGDHGCYKTGYGDVMFTLAVPRDKAPNTKQFAYLVVFSELTAPYVSKEDSNPTPSLDNPSDDYTRTFTVRLLPSRFAIVMPGGEVLMSCELL